MRSAWDRAALPSDVPAGEGVLSRGRQDRRARPLLSDWTSSQRDPVAGLSPDRGFPRLLTVGVHVWRVSAVESTPPGLTGGVARDAA